MRKNILIILLLIINIPLTFAEGDCSSCTIKDAPAQVLQKYIESQKKVVSKIKSKAQWKKDWLKLNVISERFTKSINNLLDFDTYYDDFNFILLELFTSVPKEVRRDKIKIENELTKVQNEIERSIKRWYSWINVSSKEICDWIDNCNLSWSVLELLTDVAKNNIKVLTLYKNSILWQNTVKEKFILVPDTFYQDLINSYNKATIMSCSQCKWGFFQVISEKVKKISDNMKKTWDSTKYWKDAWNLLTWEITDAELKKLEKELLEKELARQWLTKSQSQIILNNLEKFYKKTWWWWYSTENNFISNTISYITNSLWKYINTFNDVLSYLKEQDFISSRDWLEIKPLLDEKVKKDVTQAIYLEMWKVYSSLVKEASMQSIVDEKSLSELKKIHITLTKTISNLEKTVEPAQKVCKNQCLWIWNCTDY